MGAMITHHYTPLPYYILAYYLLEQNGTQFAAVQASKGPVDKPRRHHSSFFIAACPMDHHASVLRAICSGAGCKAGPVANQQKKAYAWRLQGCPCHEDLDKLLA